MELGLRGKTALVTGGSKECGRCLRDTSYRQSNWRSTKTGEPIADVSPDDPRGFSPVLSKAILGPLRAQRFYEEGMTLGYRTLYVWFEKI